MIYIKQKKNSSIHWTLFLISFSLQNFVFFHNSLEDITFAHRKLVNTKVKASVIHK